MMLISLLSFGALGVGIRYLADHHLKSHTFPLSTFLVNVVGCFLAGCIFSSPLALSHRTTLLVGFCGGLTTFSALILQSLQMMKDGETLKAFIYLLISLIAGFLSAWAGLKINHIG